MPEETRITVPEEHGAEPFIMKVPDWIKRLTGEHHFRPWLVALGPYHHYDEELKHMEEHKQRAVNALCRRTHGLESKLYSAVDDLMDFLEKEAYGDIDIRSPDDRNIFKKMMVLDGCFVLEIMTLYNKYAVSKGPESSSPGYAQDDPVFSRRGFYTHYNALRSDFTLLENQLPLRLLQNLKKAYDPENATHDDINKMVMDFLGRKYQQGMGMDCHHPLHLLHCGCYERPEKSQVWEFDRKYTSDGLVNAGLRFTPTDTAAKISFDRGVLTIPEIEVSERTVKEFFNLMAFEKLYSKVKPDVTAFVNFLDSMIDSGRDIAVLRSEGVIKNSFTSNKEAAVQFHNLKKGAFFMPPSKLCEIRREMDKYCDQPGHRWMAYSKKNLFGNPWAILGIVASLVLLVATLLQTVYTVMPYYNNKG